MLEPVLHSEADVVCLSHSRTAEPTVSVRSSSSSGFFSPSAGDVSTLRKEPAREAGRGVSASSSMSNARRYSVHLSAIFKRGAKRTTYLLSEPADLLRQRCRRRDTEMLHLLPREYKRILNGLVIPRLVLDEDIAIHA